MDEAIPLKLYTPVQTARALGVRTEKVYRWLRSGELPGEDFSESPGITRPRWRISPEAIEKFRQGRRAKPSTPSMQRRRQRRR